MKFTPLHTIKQYYLQLVQLEGQPHFLARGVTIGVFIGITPTIPFHTVLALAASFILRGSKVAALLATVLVSNPLTFFPQYYLSWQIGGWFYQNNLKWEEIHRVLEYITSDHGFQESVIALTDLGWKTISTLVMGGALLAIPFSIASYLLAFRFFAAVAKRHRQKHILK